MKNKIYLFLLTLLALAACSDNTKVTNISLNPSELIMKIGDTAHIEMIISPISAIIYNPTAWSSSNPNVAQVNDNGKVTAIYAGECTITGKTKTHEAYCNIKVLAPQYKFNFTNAILFDEGLDSTTNARNLILRLYEDQLIIDSTGNISGNGLYLNLNLHTTATDQNLPIGTYKTSDTISDFSIKPGALKQEGNSYYATGSYLGQYSDNGLSAIFIAEGHVEISDNYSISCSFSGAQSEIIEADFNGDIPVYDTSKENETSLIEYSNVSIEEYSVDNNETSKYFKIAFSANDTTIAFVARAPLSVKFLPLGTYYLSNELKAFTLVPELCSISTPQNTTKIVSATLIVAENYYSAIFTDEYNSKYLIQNSQKPQNISKLNYETFAY